MGVPWRAVFGMTAVAAALAGCGAEAVSCNCASAPRGCVYTGRASCPCAAMVCSDAGPVVDQGNAVDAVADAGVTDSGAMDVAADRPAPADVQPPMDLQPPADAPPPDAVRPDTPAEDAALTCDLATAGVGRACTADAQCRVGIFTLNCCGTERAIGYSAASGVAFDRLRDGCARLYGGIRMCGCPTLPTELDDGARTLDHSRILASCVRGMCSSHLPP